MNKLNKINKDNTELFSEELQGYLTQYFEELSKKYIRQTAQKHHILIDEWIFFITMGIGISQYDKITIPLVNSKFRAFLYMSDPYYKTDYPVSFCQSCLKRFFTFLNTDNKKIPDKIMMSLKK